MMAKLYWRVKLNGKWTWRPAVGVLTWDKRYQKYVKHVLELQLEEEE